MSWYALTHGFLEPDDQTRRTNMPAIWAPVRLPQPAPDTGAPGSLGAATADARWRWASPRAGCVTTDVATHADNERMDHASAPTRLHVAPELRAEMAGMAEALGRSEDDIWAEAAREWLLRRLRNDEPPPTTPAAASLPNPRTHQLWSEIDVMLAELRQPRYIAAPPEPTMPAA